MLKVTLIEHTPNPEKVIAAAAKLCYSSSDIDSLYDGLDEEKTQKFISHLMSLGHESPVEHASFTFGIEGVSRALLAQITRHRIASYSVKSQRYVNETDFTFVTPPEISACPEAEQFFNDTMLNIKNSYEKLADILKKNHYERFLNDGLTQKEAMRRAEKSAIEDARFVLPNACETKMIVTMNVRSLFNFFNLRCCSRAQWEIRELATLMLKLCKEVSPVLFKNAGPSCVCDKCPEGSMSCGRAKEMKEKFGIACKFVGALVFSLAIMSVPITATTLTILKTFPVTNIIFSIITIIEFISLGIVLFMSTTTSNNESRKTTKK